MTHRIKHLPAGTGTVFRSPLFDDGPDVLQIRVPISSTNEDRDGDAFSDQGLQSMLTQLQTGKIPYYADHGLDDDGFRTYRVIDMLGKWTGGEVAESTLYGIATLNDNDWRALRIAEMIQLGMPVGHSVGFDIKDYEPLDGGGMLFHEVDLFETSAVGIPCNPDAVTAAGLSAVVKSAMTKAGLTPEDKHMTDETDPKLKTKAEDEEPEEDDETKTKEEDEDQPPEGDEEDDEEKSYDILDEAAFRGIIADEVAKQVAPLLEEIKGLTQALGETKAAAEKAATVRKSLGPRGIVLARAAEPAQPAEDPEPKGATFRP